MLCVVVMVKLLFCVVLLCGRMNSVKIIIVVCKCFDRCSVVIVLVVSRVSVIRNS